VESPVRIRFGGKLIGNYWRTSKWPTDTTPAEVAWALALERGLYDRMEELHRGLSLNLLKSEFRVLLDGKPE
jgi:hypothetical protein